MTRTAYRIRLRRVKVHGTETSVTLPRTYPTKAAAQLAAGSMRYRLQEILAENGGCFDVFKVTAFTTAHIQKVY